ncbi:hypothetical protein BJY04DRAFT_77362 [Aspergillus karnatakaensis]|uniref:uncharacterized protein n=1 Tax=Aspergillus karnatakaensis TaxID=1810916 RepID=UPI003CCCDED7
MGHKVSVVTGVKSENFTQPGNAVNEIWIGDTEVISRLPFAGSDLDQAGWGADGKPKIPWHNFIIPLKRDTNETHNFAHYNLRNNCSSASEPANLICCNPNGCFTSNITSTEITTIQLSARSSDALCNSISWMIAAMYFLATPVIFSIVAGRYSFAWDIRVHRHDRIPATRFLFKVATINTACLVLGIACWGMGFTRFMSSPIGYHHGNVWQMVNMDLAIVALSLFLMAIIYLFISASCVHGTWRAWNQVRRGQLYWPLEEEEIMLEEHARTPSDSSALDHPTS